METKYWSSLVALKHYLDRSKKKQKFQYVPKPKPKPTSTLDQVWLMFMFLSGELKSYMKYANKYLGFLPSNKAVCLYLEI